MTQTDKQRCNWCDAIFDEELTSCPNCGRDDCLMFPFPECMREQISMDEMQKPTSADDGL